MTSRERFKAKYGNRGDLIPATVWDVWLSVWQAAECDMLERCVKTLAEEGYVAHANIDKIKELLNDW